MCGTGEAELNLCPAAAYLYSTIPHINRSVVAQKPLFFLLLLVLFIMYSHLAFAIVDCQLA